MSMRARVIVLGLMSLALSSPVFADHHHKPGAQRSLRNVIVMIPDGMSVAGTTLARLVKGSSLALDPLACGLMSTWNSDGTIADSAPAGSAIASGWKSQTGNIASTGSVYSLPDARIPAAGDALRPVATILEAARLSGRATGIVSTSEFMHATPADFSAHDPSRANYDNLTEQIVYNKLDVILGGGLKYLAPESRKDQEDMAAILASRGYAIVRDTAQLEQFSGGKLVGVFGKTDAHAAMSYDVDRDPQREPSLEQMTRKAIRLLSRQPRGFFLMVEGSKVDWAAHANDPLGIVSDVLAFDRAVQVAVDFARSNRETLVLAVSDHGNSGISIGDRSTSTTYDKTPWTRFTDPLKRARVTGEGFEALLPAARRTGSIESLGSEIRSLAKEWLGIDDLSDPEVDSLIKAPVGRVNNAVGAIIAKRAGIGFTSNGHTGEDVVLYKYDPRTPSPCGLMDNTEVGRFLARALGVELDALTQRLFVDAESAFADKGARVTVDTSDAENPVLVVTRNDQELRIPRNKSLAWLNGKEVDSDGVTVFNGSRWFVARNLLNLIK